MISENDTFSALFRKTFEANYHPEILQDDVDLASLTPQSPPFSFYDRHIGSQLVLKNIVYCPSLVSLLSQTCEQAVQKFRKAGHKFSDVDYNFSLEPDSPIFRDAHSVGDYYIDFAGELCSAYASKFTLHPECQNWDSVFEIKKTRETQDYDFTAESWVEVTDESIEQDAAVAALPEYQRNIVRDLRQKFPRLASWDMFAMTQPAKSMLQTLTDNVPFIWNSCQTSGHKTLSHQSLPPDARKTLIAATLSKHSSSRPRLASSAGRRFSRKKVPTVMVPRPARQGRRYRPDFRHYIQHGWARATMYDSTFIVFHCGRYERIGFRQRSSQTLYLSGIIDTVNIKKPPYRKLHIGLHTAIVQDALERQTLVDSKVRDSEQSKSRKRRADCPDHEGSTSTKRRKITLASDFDTEVFANEIAKRKLILVRLNYSVFCSPTPSSFLRVAPSCFPGHAVATKYPTQSSFSAREYISVTLKEPLGRGAVGVVHPAAVELILDSGEVLKRDMAIKLAFTSQQRKKIHDEFLIYGYLSDKVVEGIVTVHGMFKDPESGALAMLMDEAGQSLRRREIERGGDGQQISTTRKERKAFIDALKSLHRAGVRHHDIRADNLLINSQNKVFIIDLDCADYEVSEENLEHELKCLNELLEGRYRGGAYYT